MVSFRTTVIAVMTIIGAVAGGGGVALGASADDATSFDNASAALKEDASLGERFFHVEWTVGSGRPGMSRITGYVYNDYGQAAEDVELLVTGLDSAGQPLHRTFERIGDTVPSRGRSYFDVQIPASPSYQVNVDSFEFLQDRGGK